MKLQVVSVRDAAIEAFGRPVFVAHVGAAVRSFGDECKRADSELAKHPKDFSLFLIGEFDEENGLLTPCNPQVLAQAVHYVEEK